MTSAHLQLERFQGNLLVKPKTDSRMYKIGSHNVQQPHIYTKRQYAHPAHTKRNKDCIKLEPRKPKEENDSKELHF